MDLSANNKPKDSLATHALLNTNKLGLVLGKLDKKSKNELCDLLGVSYPTLQRRIQNPSKFTNDENYTIVQFLKSKHSRAFDMEDLTKPITL